MILDVEIEYNLQGNLEAYMYTIHYYSNSFTIIQVYKANVKNLAKERHFYPIGLLKEGWLCYKLHKSCRDWSMIMLSVLVLLKFLFKFHDKSG